MKQNFRIGFSCAGSIAALSFAHYLRRLGFVPVGHDCSERVFMNAGLDKGALSPSVEEECYHSFLEEFLREDCDLYIPFMDKELEICIGLTRNNDEARKKLSLCSEQAIQVCNDKLQLKDWANELGILTVQSTDTIPAFIKPRVASGGKNSLLVKQQELLDSMLKEETFHREYIAEKYMGGVLVSVDAVWDRCSSLLSFFCRERPNTSGVSSTSTSLDAAGIHQVVEDCLVRLGRSLGFYGICSIQFMIEDEKAYLLEVNPRMGGSAHHSDLLGGQVVSQYFRMMLPSRYSDVEDTRLSGRSARRIARFFTDVVL